MAKKSIKDVSSYDKIQGLLELMEKHVVDEIHVDGIVIKKSLHKTEPVAPMTGTQESLDLTEDEILFGRKSEVKRG